MKEYMKPGFIPAILHIIGFGKGYILKYKINFEDWRAHLGKDGEINLWFLSDILSKKELKKIKNMAKELNINLRDIKCSELTLQSDIIQQITDKNYWAAADIAKFSILKNYPGTVCDINTKMCTSSNFPKASYGFLTDICNSINAQNSTLPVVISSKMISVAYPAHPIVSASLEAIKANLNFMKNDSQLVAYLNTDDFRRFYTVAYYGTGEPLSYILRQVAKSGVALQELAFPKDFKKNILFTEEGHDPLFLPWLFLIKFYSKTSKAATEAWKATILEMKRDSDSTEKSITNLSKKEKSSTIPATSSFFASCSNRDIQNDKEFNRSSETNSSDEERRGRSLKSRANH